jgi:hypothetical protein
MPMIIGETIEVSSAFEKFAAAENICPRAQKMEPFKKFNTRKNEN